MIEEFIGRFHPLLLHIPIGIFTALFFMRYIYPRKELSGSGYFHFLLLCVFISSVATAIPGWLLSRSGDYDEITVQLHQWAAITFTLLSGLLYLMEAKGLNALHLKFYHTVFIFTMGMLLITGHEGGSLTHGEGYLFSSGEIKPERQISSFTYGTPVADTSSASVYTALIDPLLSKKCQSCHRASKIKGGLRLDGYGWIMKGGKGGEVLVAGMPAKSEMIRRVLLPIEEEKHMPPKGKMQLTDKEIALLHWWILNGASAIGRVNEVSVNDTIKNFLSTNTKSIDQGEGLPIIDPVGSALLSKLRSVGFSLQPVALGSGWLEVSTVNMASVTDKDLYQLLPVAHNILWLSITDNYVTDSGMNILDSCINLRRLNLSGTRISDALVTKLNFMPHLNYLNLVGTSFTDKGLMALSEAKSLRKLYCWRTHITENGVSLFLKKHPEVKIEMGAER